MDLLKASELDLDDPDLKSLYDSPVVAELAETREHGGYKFNSGV